MKNFLSTNTCLISVTIQKFFDPTNKTVIGKMKEVSEGKIIDEFVGLKSKMYSMKNTDGKESDTAKGVSIATELNEFKDTLFNKKNTQVQNEKNSRQKTQNWNVRNQQNIIIVL